MHFLLINTSKTLMILIVLEVLIILFDYFLFDTYCISHMKTAFLLCYMTKSREK
ncbi:hypothetical protein SACOL1318 [Staphylococcus aureus subsp. aureus COL]|uniref:Uncharacterized protein n=1 Tax=Staphylococcus aureus (strain COL) TaxID=93062 RepID=A0A0H2X239_STAAC|nr:hypothetical protein SACOL1318 [Staphylococcus aureus subsp. aureus COL]EEV82657.1 conserved hypothetical protein [Staphylococcus aureus A5948]EFB99191.1 conserved hypothetical protein [Staphylococcus aureus A9765]